jgi:polar amino acid transport system substrate-binding protein
MSSQARRFRFVRLCSLVATVPLLLAGCGMNDTSASAGGDTKSQAPGVRSEVAALLPADLKGKLADRVPNRGKPLVMATDVTVGEPIAWTEEGDKTVKGLSVDMAGAVGYVLGVDVKTTHSAFDGIIPGVQGGRYDMSLSIMLDTKERQKSVDFVDYLIDGSSILVAGDSDLKDLTLDDMCGLKAGALRGSVEVGYLEEQSKRCKAAGKKSVDIGTYQGNNEMLLAIQSRRLEVMMGAASQLAYVESNSNGKVRQGGEPIGQALDGIALNKNSGLTGPVSEALQLLIDSGTYKKIFALYGMEQNAVDKATVNNAKL